MGYLDDLIGIKTVVAPDGTDMPRRAALRFEGATVEVEDDPIAGETIVRVGGDAPVGELVSIEVEISDLLVIEDAAEAVVIRMSSTDNAWSLAGVDATGLVAYRKLLVNIGDEDIPLLDGGENAGPFRLSAGGLTLPPNGVFEILWVPASDGVLAGWRLL